MRLPDYSPPNEKRAALAVALAPLCVLVVFTLIVLQVIDPDTGIAAFVACTVWVVYEMSVYQRTLDRYNGEYASRHLQWRSQESLVAITVEDHLAPTTRDFVRRYIRADRQVRRDGEWG